MWKKVLYTLKERGMLSANDYFFKANNRETSQKIEEIYPYLTFPRSVYSFSQSEDRLKLLRVCGELTKLLFHYRKTLICFTGLVKADKLK